MTMGESDCRYVITRDKYDAVLLDLDGVVTDTANLHAACWKQMFDEYLLKRATPGEALRLFDLDTDYRVYIDGKPRFDGVRDFLASRKIRLPEGSSEDSPQTESVCGLGNRKNPTAGGLYAWELQKGRRELHVRVDGQLVFNNVPMMLRAAASGFGLACVLDEQTEEMVADGRLVRVLEEWCPPFAGYHLYYP